MKQTLSTGVIFISKPSKLHVPVWQMVSAKMDALPIRAATWWTRPPIPSTTATTSIECWDTNLSHPGQVQIATSGTWQGKRIGLKGGGGNDANHAKIGVSLDPSKAFCFFGDENQQGALDGDCASSQNGRGGEFYVSTSPIFSRASPPFSPATLLRSNNFVSTTTTTPATTLVSSRRNRRLFNLRYPV